jgi:uncharacterized protein (TIGR02453 family)
MAPPDDMPTLPLRFTPAALTFLRALKRHNDREWFKARRETYETELLAPMIAIIEQLAVDFRRFAPDLVASPRLSLYRIYRDTRFSADKSPLKTHIAAVFPSRGLGKHEGAGLYFHVSPTEVVIAGGMYAPLTPHLVRVREHLAVNLKRFRKIVDAPAFRRACGEVHGERLTRVPRGYPANHPAAHYLAFKQLLVGREHPPVLATLPRFYGELVKSFQLMAPFVSFINEALTAPSATARDQRS